MAKAGGILNAWVRKMSGYVKNLDSKHLVATGYHGQACASWITAQ